MAYMNYNASEDASLLSKSKVHARPKLVQGVGISDLPHPVRVNGKLLKSYGVWSAMLMRCYSASYQKNNPTYVGCSVDKDWQLFSNFERWFLANYTEGCALDKDILFPGNKIYSAETCVFVPQKLNKLLLDAKAARGEYPIGVCFHKRDQKFQARVCTEAGRKHLGYFATALAAHQAWQLAKSDNITAAVETNDPRIRAAFDLRVAQLRDDRANGRITLTL